MKFRLKQWCKPLTGGSIFILLAVMAGAWYADEAEKPPLVLRAEHETKDVPRDETAIIGLEQASEHKALQNPFSLLHETEQEVREVVPPLAQLPKKESSTQDKLADTLTPAQNGGQVPGDGQHIVLCGIMEGCERLALLRYGTQTMTAGVGEMVFGWQVTDIGTATVTVERSGQVLSLALVMDGEAGAK